MKLWDIIKKVGTTALNAALPGTGPLIIDSVNEFLPAEKKLPVHATGDAVSAALTNLSPDQQAVIMGKEFDVEILQINESHSTVKKMLESDANDPHSTRPYIAKGAFLVVAFTVLVTISVWAFGVLTSDDDMVREVMSGWQFVLAVIGPLVTLLWAYFGVLKQEHKNRLDAANGATTPAGLAGVVASLVKK
ncbi:hypothetical protein [Salinibius halmophilus]|uniref:hypothetical protein n=1 Tax=Salinibius halmophilus TaxID=1853216 RepID=UPI000E6745A3|nr:hypothetical protein [Salinibius halmophilus]